MIPPRASFISKRDERASTTICVTEHASSGVLIGCITDESQRCFCSINDGAIRPVNAAKTEIGLHCFAAALSPARTLVRDSHLSAFSAHSCVVVCDSKEPSTRTRIQISGGPDLR